MQAASVTVSNTATKIVGAGAPIAGAGAQRVLVQNRHATDALVIGGSGVTASTGYAISAGQTLDLGNVDPGTGAIYAIRGGSVDVTAQILALP
jgi:hypothetical protein